MFSGDSGCVSGVNTTGGYPTWSIEISSPDEYMLEAGTDIRGASFFFFFLVAQGWLSDRCCLTGNNFIPWPKVPVTLEPRHEMALV